MGMEKNIFTNNLDKILLQNYSKLYFLIQGYCYGKGENVIPTLHIQDLCSWIEVILRDMPNKKYIFLKDDSLSTQ